MRVHGSEPLIHKQADAAMGRLGQEWKRLGPTQPGGGHPIPRRCQPGIRSDPVQQPPDGRAGHAGLPAVLEGKPKDALLGHIQAALNWLVSVGKAGCRAVEGFPKVDKRHHEVRSLAQHPRRKAASPRAAQEKPGWAVCAWLSLRHGHKPGSVLMGQQSQCSPLCLLQLSAQRWPGGTVNYCLLLYLRCLIFFRNILFPLIRCSD